MRWNPFKRKPKVPEYDYVAHMKALLAITEKAIAITKSLSSVSAGSTEERK